MASFNFKPEYLTQETCKENATRQMLSFVLDPKSEFESDPWHDPLLSRDVLQDEVFTDGPAILNWTSHNIYDVDGLLVFRDNTLDIGGGNEWRVRTAASDVLQTPVKSIYVGSKLDLEGLAAKALVEIQKHDDLVPLIVTGEETARVVCYSYPKMGIKCQSRTKPEDEFVIDIEQPIDRERLDLIPINSQETEDNPESVTAVWSPYDFVTRSTIAHLRRLWNLNLALLPPLPAFRADLDLAITFAQSAIDDMRTTNPPVQLIAQIGTKNCAAASALMILRQRNIRTPIPTEAVLAREMHTGTHGATPEDQVNAINRLFRGLVAEPDDSPTFAEAKDEILSDRPFRTANPVHARTVGGFRSERDPRTREKVDKAWLLIYDPEPPNDGRIYKEIWDEKYHRDFIYVKSR